MAGTIKAAILREMRVVYLLGELYRVIDDLAMLADNHLLVHEGP